MSACGVDADGIAETEADRYMKCPGCGEWFDIITKRGPAAKRLELVDGA